MLVDHPILSKPLKLSDTFIAHVKSQSSSEEETKSVLDFYSAPHFYEKLATGIYLSDGNSHLYVNPVKDKDGNSFFGEYNQWGVCDNYQQILDKFPDINDPNKLHVISLTPVLKSDQPARGGWRWHKHGAYIGNLSPQHEYLYDEDSSIQQVYMFDVYELEDLNANKSLAIRGEE